MLNHLARRAEVTHVGAVRDCFSATRPNFLNHLVRRAEIGTGAIPSATQIVHDHFGAVFRQHQGVLAADAAARSGHDRDAILAKAAHALLP